MTSWWVRLATPKDRTAIRDLTRRTRRELQGGLRTPARDAGRDGAEMAWVVEAGRREIVGCCTVREGANGEWELVELALAGRWRGYGLGRSLVDHAVRAVRGEGGLVLLARGACFAGRDELARALGFAAEDGAEGPVFRRSVARIS